MHIPARSACKMLMRSMRTYQPWGTCVGPPNCGARRPLFLSSWNSLGLHEGRRECTSSRTCEPAIPPKCECPSTHVPDGDWCQPIFDCAGSVCVGAVVIARPRDRWCQLPETGNFGPIEIARRAEERAATVWLRSNKDALAYSAWFAGRLAGRYTDPLAWLAVAGMLVAGHLRRPGWWSVPVWAISMTAVNVAVVWSLWQELEYVHAWFTPRDIEWMLRVGWERRSLWVFGDFMALTVVAYGLARRRRDETPMHRRK